MRRAALFGEGFEGAIGTSMKTPEPQETRFDLHGLLFGVPIRIRPLFWVSSALLGIRYYSDPDGGGAGYFAFWMLAALVSVLLHEYGHVLVGRIFGLRGGIVLGGLGGQTTGLDTLPRRWQRVLVLLAGPVVGLLILAGIWGITAFPFPEALLGGAATAVATGLDMVGRLNAYWALLNLLPLWPLDGGRIACELGEGLLGRRGVAAALWLCIADTGALSVLLVLVAELAAGVLRSRSPLRPVSQEILCVVALLLPLVDSRFSRLVAGGANPRPMIQLSRSRNSSSKVKAPPPREVADAPRGRQDDLQHRWLWMRSPRSMSNESSIRENLDAGLFTAAIPEALEGQQSV